MQRFLSAAMVTQVSGSEGVHLRGPAQVNVLDMLVRSPRLSIQCLFQERDAKGADERTPGAETMAASSGRLVDITVRRVSRRVDFAE